ncbi:MAG: DnaD domain protein [Lachnospiraceae bacterium]
MCKITSCGLNNGITIVSNRFIDEYLVDASGLNLKVYLYLLRYTYVPEADISLKNIAHSLDITESQVVKSLKYWQKLSLLDFTLDDNNEIKRISIADVNTVADKADAETTATVSETDRKPSAPIQEKVFPHYSPEQINVISDDQHFKKLLNIVERYLAPKTMGFSDINTLAGIYEGFGFSDELICHLYDYCHSSGSCDHRYVEKVATSWAEKNIRTIDDAQYEEQFYDKTLLGIRKSLGITHGFKQTQLNSIKNWIYEYRLPDDVIIAACDKAAIAEVDKPFAYASKIIESWHKSGVKSLEDIDKFDLQHSNETAKKKSAGKTASGTKSVPYNQFNDYHQRTYTPEEEAELERKLILRNSHTQEERDALADRLRAEREAVSE